jgi:hypothetical protein
MTESDLETLGFVAENPPWIDAPNTFYISKSSDGVKLKWKADVLMGFKTPSDLINHLTTKPIKLKTHGSYRGNTGEAKEINQV